MCLLTHRAAIGSSAAPESLWLKVVLLMERGKGERLLGRHDFPTSGSEKRNVTA